MLVGHRSADARLSAFRSTLNLPRFWTGLLAASRGIGHQRAAAGGRLTGDIGSLLPIAPNPTLKEICHGNRNRAQFYRDVPSGSFYGFSSDGATISQGLIDNWWRQGMAGGATAHYDCITFSSESDFTDNVKTINEPVLIIYGEGDQVVLIDTRPTRPSRTAR